MTATLLRLAFAGIRSRLLATTLTIVLAGSASATIVLAVEIGATTSDPWQRTFAAAHGAHVLVTGREAIRAVASIPGIADRGAPVAMAMANMRPPSGDERRIHLAAPGARPRVNAPVRTEGGSLRSGGIVLERSLARALGMGIGTTLEVSGPRGSARLPVLGTAISPSQPRFPRRNPGIGWVTRRTLAQIEPDRQRWWLAQGLRLSDPAAAPAFAERALMALPPADLQSGEAGIETWQEQRATALEDARPAAILLTMFTIMLLIVTVAVVAILAGARASTQSREIGLLKAVGLTPRQVSAVFVLEAAALGIVAVAAGFALGAMLAPRLAAFSAVALLGGPKVAAEPWHALLAAGVILPILAVSTFAATRRATRLGVLGALSAAAVRPASRSRLLRSVARLSPLPVALGLSDLAARRRRAFWLAAAITVTGAVIVVTLALQAVLSRPTAAGVSDVPSELPVLVYTFDAVLILITAATLLAVSLLSVRERIRDFGVLKAVGLTPRQIASSLVSAQAALAALAGVVSIPLGIALYFGLYRIAGDTSEAVAMPAWWALALVPFATVLIVVAATGLPARLATRTPTAEALRYE